MMKKCVGVLLLLLLLNLTACGYFLYPERRGQTQGRIDTAVTLLDAAGLLIGVVPGVIAFVVDITTGAIYVPTEGKTIIDKHIDEINKMQQGKEQSSLEEQGAVDRTLIADMLADDLGVTIEPESIAFYSVDGDDLSELKHNSFEQIE